MSEKAEAGGQGFSAGEQAETGGRNFSMGEKSEAGGQNFSMSEKSEVGEQGVFVGEKAKVGEQGFAAGEKAEVGKRERISEVFNEIGEGYVEEAAVFAAKEMSVKTGGWKKAVLVAACAAACLAVAFLLVGRRSLSDRKNGTGADGSGKKVVAIDKDTERIKEISDHPDYGYGWNTDGANYNDSPYEDYDPKELSWEYQTVFGKYRDAVYDGRDYHMEGYFVDPVEEKWIGEPLGNCRARGYDFYNEQEHEEDFAAYRLAGIAKELMIAVRLEGEYYAFRNCDLLPLDNLGAFLDGFQLTKTASLQNFYAGRSGEALAQGFKPYTFEHMETVLQMLSKCREARYVDRKHGGAFVWGFDDWEADEEGKREGGKYQRTYWRKGNRRYVQFEFWANALGAKGDLSIMDSGYVEFLLFGQRYRFYIGKAAAKELVDYVMAQPATQTEFMPFRDEIRGKFLEFDGEYLLMDNSAALSSEMLEKYEKYTVYRIPVEHPLVRYLLEVAHPETLHRGDILSVRFLPGHVDWENGNMVYGIAGFFFVSWVPLLYK